MGMPLDEILQTLTLPPDDTPPEEVVKYCMAALRDDDEAETGKLINWALGGDMVRSIHGGDPEAFLKWTRRSPVFDCMVGCESFEVLTDSLSTIPATQTRGAMVRVRVRVAPTERVVDGPHSVRGRIGKPPERDFLWTIQQQRRPPPGRK